MSKESIELIALILAFAGIVINSLVVIFKGGRLTEQIMQNSNIIIKNEHRLIKLEDKLDVNVERIDDRVTGQAVESSKFHDRVAVLIEAMEKQADAISRLTDEYHNLTIMVAKMGTNLDAIVKELIKSNESKQ